MGSCRRYLLERDVYLRASCVPILKAKGGGKIVNIASIAGHRGAPGGSAYSAAKGGVINLTRQMAVELGQFKINVNSVSPGFTPTRLTTIYEYQEGARDESSYSGAASGSNFTAAPLGSRGELDDYVGPVLFLSSQWANFITGSICPWRVDAWLRDDINVITKSGTGGADVNNKDLNLFT